MTGAVLARGNLGASSMYRARTDKIGRAAGQFAGDQLMVHSLLILLPDFYDGCKELLRDNPSIAAAVVVGQGHAAPFSRALRTINMASAIL